MPADDYKQVKQKIILLKAKVIDTALEKWENENNITADDYERLSKEHFRVPSPVRVK